jgi:hypothetical protein
MARLPLSLHQQAGFQRHDGDDAGDLAAHQASPRLRVFLARQQPAAHPDPAIGRRAVQAQPPHQEVARAGSQPPLPAGNAADEVDADELAPTAAAMMTTATAAPLPRAG